MLWFRAPEKVYFKKGCLPVALKELKDVMGKKRAFIVTDATHSKTTNNPAVIPPKSIANPKIGVTTPPPATAVIIRPEI